MIQRIQSVYLLMVIICCIVASLFPLFQAVTTDAVYELSIVKTSYTIQAKTSILSINYSLISITIFISILSIITLFRYSNRSLQIKFINIVLMLVLLFMGVLFFEYRQLVSLSAANVNISYSLIFVPIIIVLLFLARSGIKKDDALVRSADRLR